MSTIAILSSSEKLARTAGELFVDQAGSPHNVAVGTNGAASLQWLTDHSSPHHIDVIITLDEEARKNVHGILGGAKAAAQNALFYRDLPVAIHWSCDEFLKRPRQSKDAITEKIDSFLRERYLDTIQSQKELRTRLIDALPEGIIIHDVHRRIRVFNAEAEKITGRKREEVLGRDCHEVFGSDGLCGSECSFCSTCELPKEDRQYQVRFINANVDEKLLKLTVTLVPANTPGLSDGGVIAAIHDITEEEEMRWTLRRQRSFHGMIGVSDAMQEVFQTIRRVVSADYPVLISGESGTGKELVANAIHRESRRKGAAFVPVNCGALPENILESELFGHVRGAFTGAIRDKKGRFELADRGTLFLDEVGELTPAFQVKLLRVLQEGRFERVGGEKQISVDVRLIAATNRDLRQLVNEETFRDDLFYRLAVVPIHLPPLRKRIDDIPPLIEHIMQDVRKEISREDLTIHDSVLDILLAYEWPGNIRELINAMRFAAIRCEGNTIRVRHLPPEIIASAPQNRVVKRPAITRTQRTSAREFSATKKGRKKLTASAVASALEQTGGNKLKAAKLLGVGRATLYRFLNSQQNPA